MEEVVETWNGQGGFCREWSCLGAACFKTAPKQLYVAGEKLTTLVTSFTLISWLLSWNRFCWCPAILLFFLSIHSPILTFSSLLKPTTLLFLPLSFTFIGHVSYKHGSFKPKSDHVILLLKISQWLPLSLRVMSQFVEWPTRLWGLTSTLHPTPFCVVTIWPFSYCSPICYLHWPPCFCLKIQNMLLCKGCFISYSFP